MPDRFAARRLDAGSFAFVMATGILSVAARIERHGPLSEGLLVLAGAAWVALAALVLGGRRRRARVGLQSFAAVAATAVLGARLRLAGDTRLALAFLLVAAVLWVLLLARRPSLAHATGASLLVVVATESLAVLAALLASERRREPFLVLGMTAWILGLVAYPIVVAAIAAEQRRRRRFSPDMWILMGALAISTLAGAELTSCARSVELHQTLRVAALAIWVTATCLIVPLALIDLRGYAKWRYTSSRWSFAFPLAMYAVATDALGHAAGIAPLDDVAHWFFYVALVCWTTVMVGLVRRVVKVA